MMLQRFFLSLLIAIPFLLLSSRLAAQPLVHQDYEVVLNPNANQIQVATGPKCSPNPNGHAGCMHFPVNTIGEITFSLVGSPHRTTCSALTQNPKRVITKIVLSTTPRQNNPNAGVYGDRVDPWLRQYAFANVDLSNGVVYEALVSEGRTSVTLTNDNSHPHQPQPKSFWYQVTVTDCAFPYDKWVFDPRGDNEGR